MKKIYKLTVEPITAVHIGTGNTLTPLDYKVIGDKYFRYEWDKILDSISDNSTKMAEFGNIKSDNLAKLREFFYMNFDKRISSYICRAASEFVSAYNKNLPKDPIESGMFVQENVRQSINGVIPGSSLKGSIRTAVLDSEFSERKNEGANLDNRNNTLLTAQIFGIVDEKNGIKYDAKKDPFRCLAISDCLMPYNADSYFVGKIWNIHRNPEKAPGIPNYAEIIAGNLTGYNNMAVGKLIIDEELGSENKNIPKMFTVKELRKACNSFYLKEFANEYKKFYLENKPQYQIINKLKSTLEDAVTKSDKFIIRVGHWSQCEFVTIAGVRNPKTRKTKDGKPMPSGTSRFVLDYNGQYVPLGWCVCTLTEMSSNDTNKVFVDIDADTKAFEQCKQKLAETNTHNVNVINQQSHTAETANTLKVGEVITVKSAETKCKNNELSVKYKGNTITVANCNSKIEKLVNARETVKITIKKIIGDSNYVGELERLK